MAIDIVQREFRTPDGLDRVHDGQEPATRGLFRLAQWAELLPRLDGRLGDEVARNDDQVADARPRLVIAHDHQAGVVRRRQPGRHRAKAPLTSLRSIRPLVALSPYSAAQTPQ